MPKLFVPHVRQIEDGYCLPACVEMVLAFYGIHRPQAQIAKQLDIIEGAGIPAPRILRLASRQLQIVRQQGEVSDLIALLNESIPPIMEVSTAQLTHWHGEESQHVVLLTAIQGDIDGTATINDPAFDAPMNLPMNELILAWLDRDNYFATIRRK